MVIRRIHVTYHVQADKADREVVDRVHSFHARKCPVYRTLSSAIAVTTEYEIDFG
jgi:uncharacterized OsmC-like protein